MAIAEAYGLRCAEEVVAARPLPGFDMAAIDGYAVRSVDVIGARRGRCRSSCPVVGEIPAGSRQPLRLQPGQAVRGRGGCAAAHARRRRRARRLHRRGQRARLEVTRGVPSAAFVRRIGEDVQPGDVAVRRDAVIGAAQVGLLAAAGRDKVLVHPRPRVSVVSVGDELVELARTPGAGQVADVCSHALTAAAREAGAETSRARPRARRRRARSAPAVQDRLPFSDVIVRLRGRRRRAPGPRCRPRSPELGELDTTRVAMHPGSTQAFGRLGPDAVPTFLFPSHPATALLLFEVLVAAADPARAQGRPTRTAAASRPG